MVVPDENVHPPRIHDIEELMALLAEQGEAVPESAESFIELTDFAVQFRYEPYFGLDEPLDRQGIALRVRMLFDNVRARFERDGIEDDGEQT